MSNSVDAMWSFREAIENLEVAYSNLIKEDQSEVMLDIVCGEIEHLNEKVCNYWEFVTGKELSF